MIIWDGVVKTKGKLWPRLQKTQNDGFLSKCTTPTMVAAMGTRMNRLPWPLIYRVYWVIQYLPRIMATLGPCDGYF